MESEFGGLVKLADELPDVPPELLKAVRDLDHTKQKRPDAGDPSADSIFLIVRAVF
jgi:hypothetical protein